MRTTFIYALCCPCSGEIRYIGKANRPKERLKAHLWSGKRAQSSHKRNWIDKLKSKDLRPVLLVLEEVIITNWNEKEKYYIKYYKDLGCKLTNTCIGGEGLTFGNQTSFKKGNISYNTGSRFKKPCSICGKLFEVSPSGDNKYKCCSMKCSSKYRSLNPNKGCFKKGLISNKRLPVLQINRSTNEVVNEYNSITEAQAKLGITHISSVINGKRRSAGGFNWRIK